MKKNLSVILALLLMLTGIVLPVSADEYGIVPISETYEDPYATMLITDTQDPYATMLIPEEQRSDLFVDIVKGSDLETAVKKLVETGIVHGYGDGTFRPSGTLSRAEFCKMVNKLFGYTELDTTGFSDVKPEDWYYNDVLIAKKQGYIMGFEDATFRGDSKVTREQVCTILNRIFGLYTLFDIQITDTVSDWALSSVKAVVSNGFMNLEPGNTFRATQDMTRQEFATVFVLFCNIVKAPCTYCGSTEHNADGHPKCPTCGSAEHTKHPTSTGPIGGGPGAGPGGGGPSAPSIKCSVCGSTGHTTENHPKCSVCGSTSHTTHPTCPDCGSTEHVTHPTCEVCNSKDHTTANHPKCPDCGSTEHTTHPKCPVCGSTEHRTHPEGGEGTTVKECNVCGSKDHTTENHPKCPDCGSTSHTTHPTCPDCGSKEHTVHPTCPDCGSKEHTIHPTCPDCGSKEHEVHPSCPDCGSIEHTVHPTCPDCGSKDHEVHPDEEPDMTIDDIPMEEMQKLYDDLNAITTFSHAKEFRPFFNSLKGIIYDILEESKTTLITPEHVSEQYNDRLELLKADYKALCDDCKGQFNNIVSERAPKYKAVLVDYFYEIIPEEAFEYMGW